MSASYQVPDETRRKQEQVSDPAVSAWVSANAGTGKTTVLVRRVIRLLLAGNPPARILCLTFTKAAAANMANKVLQTLSRWVRLDDAELDAAIREVSNEEPTPALRATARRLFAEALETPGGLKVQTIHAFCDRVLHQFPMEAGVQAGFEVLDEVQEADLLRRAREYVLIEAANAPKSTLGQALETAVAAASDDSFDKALNEAVRGRRKLARLDELGGAAEVARALGLVPGDSVAAVKQEILNSGPLPRSEWTSAAAALLPFGGNAAKRGEQLQRAARASDDAVAVEDYFSVFFTGDGDPRDEGGFGTKKARDAAPDLYARIFAARDRLIPLRDRLAAVRALERTSALFMLVQATIKRFEQEKRTRGALDYSDLIEKTADMLADTGSAWVLYKLDGGIDHVLIDEAQDTSPEQWSVIERLTEEFFAGSGARADRERTIFVVGDEKQSIFSFQGADPRLFGEKRNDFERRVTGAGQIFHPEKLLLSFRSAVGVLGAVDAVFKREVAYKGLSSGDETNPIHQAIRTRAPALVEIWDTEKPADEPDTSLPWDAPIDAQSETSPTVKLAQRIAAAVKRWTEGGLAIEDRETKTLRAATAADVIVLVRRRGPLFEAILQALKQADVLVAGADRLQLTEHIAVMDLMALGDTLLLEADDLALACALKSPLFGLSEDDLYAVATGRKGTLAASLAAKAETNPRLKDAAEKLARWRREAASLRPFDFYSRVLGRDGGRRQMLARLSHEAADAIDEFLARALAYARTETPSLAGFLHFLRRTATEVKRDLEVESDAVRVMTVHGAKGLEAPLVILADTTTIPDGRNTRLHDLPESEAFVWAGRTDSESLREQAARAAVEELRLAEYRRLLYVALTRAADVLVVCGAEGERELKDGCWYRLVRDALAEELVEMPASGSEGTVFRWRPEAAATIVPGAKVEPAQTDVPPWARQPAPAARPAPRRIVPSQFDPDDAPRAAFTPAAPGAIDPRRRGDLLHRLLQHLPGVPAEKRQDAAARLLGAVAKDLPEAEHTRLTEEAICVIEEPALAALFGPASRVEVDVVARLPAGEVMGRIDRIAMTPDAILVADFKTGTPPAPAEPTPENYLFQLAVYRQALARIYPGKAMRALLVWTAGPAIREISVAALDSLPAIQAFTPPGDA
ncbi:MAG: double-strand break repair helicase AddA [Bradyrhizobiaceae bacterium]|nr:double-strand break repair helicase AddA [Bradyrhizobiaceae bacterium]